MADNGDADDDVADDRLDISRNTFKRALKQKRWINMIYFQLNLQNFTLYYSTED